MKRWDFLIIGLAVALSLVALLPLILNQGDIVRIEQDGVVLYEDYIEKDVVIEADGNTIVINDGHVTITTAQCPDKLCMKGECTALHPLICLPNKLSVTIVSEEVSLDAISS